MDIELEKENLIEINQKQECDGNCYICFINKECKSFTEYNKR